MAFADSVAKLLEGVENIGDVSAYVQQLNEEHAQEVADKESVYQTKITDLENTLSAKDQKIVDLKLTNYDLIQSKPVENEPGPNTGGEPAPTQKGIGSLFETKE